MSKNKTVLIVEDDDTLVTVYAFIFAQAGYETITGSNGSEGLELAQKHLPDMILVDVQMPDMDGPTMIKKLRQKPWGKDSKIIVLTNIGRPETTFDFEKYNVVDVLTKVNIEPDQLLSIVAEHLDS